jgi:hypothetical protein
MALRGWTARYAPLARASGAIAHHPSNDLKWSESPLLAPSPFA